MTRIQAEQPVDEYVIASPLADPGAPRRRIFFNLETKPGPPVHLHNKIILPVCFFFVWSLGADTLGRLFDHYSSGCGPDADHRFRMVEREGEPFGVCFVVVCGFIKSSSADN